WRPQNRISRGANQQQYNRFEVKKLNGATRNRKMNDFFRKLFRHAECGFQKERGFSPLVYATQANPYS
ncbi:MAG: hypothetical protein ACLQLH_12440, partial [Terracidiphilus sp.]